MHRHWPRVPNTKTTLHFFRKLQPTHHIHTSSPFLYISGAISSFRAPGYATHRSSQFVPPISSLSPPLRSFLSLNSPQISLFLSKSLYIYRIVSILQGKFCVLAKTSTLGFSVLQITQLGFSQIDEIFDLAPCNLLFRSLLRNFGA